MFDNFINKRLNNEKDNRAKFIRETSVIGIFANLLFSAIKLAVGLVANSISIISDAVNNLTDALSSVITIIGIRLANKPPDYKHPLGHGRVEYLTSLVIASIIILTGFEFLKESIERIFNPSTPTYQIYQIILVAVTVIGKGLLSAYFISAGKKANSDALIGSGQDAKMDVLATIATIVGAVITYATGLHVDGYIGVLLSIFILYTGYDLIRDTIDDLIGIRPNHELAYALKDEIAKYPPIMGAYDLILHNYGPTLKIGTVNVEIPDYVNIEKAYEAMDAAQKSIYHKHHIFLTFGVYSVNTYDQEIVKLREQVSAKVFEITGVKNIHNFNYDKATKLLRFDVIVDFNIKDFHKFREQVDQKVKEIQPDITTQINIDLDYS